MIFTLNDEFKCKVHLNWELIWRTSAGVEQRNTQIELIETSRDLKCISVNVEDKWKEVNLDVYEIYEKAEARAMGLE